MAKVLLIQPHNDRRMNKPFDNPSTPLSLIYIATAIQNFHPVKVYDRNIIFNDSDFLKVLREYNPDIIGMGSITTEMLLDLSYMCKLIKKEMPKTTIVIGGIHATIEPDTFLDRPEVDYVIRGEGEEAFLEFCNTHDKNPQKLKELKNINKNSLRPFINMDDLKLPDYSLIDLKKYSTIFVSLSRGCSGNCSFCYSCGMWGKDGKSFIRIHSTEKVKEIFKELIEKYHVKSFSIADDNFVAFKTRAVEVCDFLSKYKVNFFCFGRADYLDDEMMKALKKAGCHTLFIGAESGSQRVLDFLNKRTQIAHNINAIRLCKKYGIVSDTSFMIGITTETLEELNMTKQFIKKYKPDITNILIFNPLPGTAAFHYCIANNLIKNPTTLEEWAHWTGDFLEIKHNTSKIPDKVLINTLKEMAKFGFYKYNIKKFFYWVKAGEVKYALKGIKRVLLRKNEKY